ncbi:MAG: DNA polymerase III subunit delta [Patescibacteria group bacterium]|nr:DNA polymerase III subunit delta [Patescibacteria group bacterium]MBU1876738.1 DNA polymerase III subunit delta [Patescibacteria group bacterium]
MIIFIYGPDTYRLNRKLDEIIGQYQKINKSGLNLRHFDLLEKDISFSDFIDEFGQTSMFKEKKLIIIKGIFSHSDFEDKFLSEIKHFVEADDVIIVVEKNKILSTNRLFKALKKKARFQEFNLLQGKDLEKWAQKEIEKYGANIEAIALSKLIDCVGSDLWRLSNEIQKLINYQNKNKITIEDINLLISPKVDPDIFQTINFMASKNRKEALKLLKKHIEKGDAPLYLLSMISFQFKNLLIIKELVDKNIPYYLIAKETGIHPYVVKKTYPQVKQFTLLELKKIYQKIFEVDLDIKAGRIDPEMALDLLITGI